MPVVDDFDTQQRRLAVVNAAVNDGDLEPLQNLPDEELHPDSRGIAAAHVVVLASHPLAAHRAVEALKCIHDRAPDTLWMWTAPSEGSQSPMELAIQHRLFPIVAYLIRQRPEELGRADPRRGWLAVHHAAYHGDGHTLQVSVEFFPWTRLARTHAGQTPSDLASMEQFRGSNRHQNVVTYLQICTELTPLQHAALAGNHAMVEAYLRRGGDCTVVSGEGMTMDGVTHRYELTELEATRFRRQREMIAHTLPRWRPDEKVHQLFFTPMFRQGVFAVLLLEYALNRQGNPRRHLSSELWVRIIQEIPRHWGLPVGAHLLERSARVILAPPSPHGEEAAEYAEWVAKRAARVAFLDRMHGSPLICPL